MGATAIPDLDVIIIGAGLSGMYQLYRLRELGFRRAHQFDWRIAAEATIEAYRRAK